MMKHVLLYTHNACKRSATTDIILQGRVKSGHGLEWFEDMYQDPNIPFQNRGESVNEFMQVMEDMD
jgi:hypothetical protein